MFENLILQGPAEMKEKEVSARPANSAVDDVIIFKQLRDKSTLGIMIDIDDNTAVQQATRKMDVFLILFLFIII